MKDWFLLVEKTIWHLASSTAWKTGCSSSQLLPVSSSDAFSSWALDPFSDGSCSSSSSDSDHSCAIIPTWGPGGKCGSVCLWEWARFRVVICARKWNLIPRLHSSLFRLQASKRSVCSHPWFRLWTPPALLADENRDFCIAWKSMSAGQVHLGGAVLVSLDLVLSHPISPAWDIMGFRVRRDLLSQAGEILFHPFAQVLLWTCQSLWWGLVLHPLENPTLIVWECFLHDVGNTWWTPWVNWSSCKPAGP